MENFTVWAVLFTWLIVCLECEKTKLPNAVWSLCFGYQLRVDIAIFVTLLVSIKDLQFLTLRFAIFEQKFPKFTVSV